MKKTKIAMIVDDDEMTSRVTERMLNKLGFSVICSRCGRDALKDFQENRGSIGIMILDVIMPDMTGVQVFHMIREADCKLPIIMTSGFDTAGLKGFACQLTDTVLKKPYTFNDLKGRIEAALSEQWSEFS